VLASDLALEGVPAEDDGVFRQLRWYWRDHEFPAMSVREKLRLERSNQAVLDRHVAELEPDLVSFWAMGGMSMSLVEAVRRRGTPYAGVVHEDWLLYGPKVDGWQRTFGGRLRSRLAELAGIPTRLTFDRAGVRLFNSEATRDKALAVWDLADTGVITPGVDLERFAPAEAKPWEGRLLYLGRIDPRKGIAVAIDALARVPSATLRVVAPGDPEHLSALRTQAIDAGLANRVTFGEVPRDAVPAELAAADAVIFPVTWEEPWGLVPLEAMSVGTPVVASGRGGSAESLRHGENAITYSPAEDPDQLAAAIALLAADPGLRERLRAGGHETAARHSLARFDLEIAEAHERLLA
jgi:glycosyltransferase involved in cell wall biosynthesis